MKTPSAYMATEIPPHEPNITEESLVHAAQSGDHDALNRLLLPYQASLLRLCYGMLGHTEEAEDAVQETLYRAIRALPRFRPEARMHTWLFRIALNVCIDWKHKRQRTVPLDTQDVEAKVPATVEATILTQMQLEQALASLVPRQRAVFLLREEQGWSVTEIANVLQCTQRRINNELYHARRILKAWTLRQEQEGSNL